MPMIINLTKKQVLNYAKRDEKLLKNDSILAAKMKEARKRGYMTQEDLVAVAKWKWHGPQLQRLVRQNSSEDIKEITSMAFSTKSERLKIELLIVLYGVNWPMASVILHFAFPEKYPILDVNAMKAVGGTTKYTHMTWKQYTDLCNKTAKSMNVSMRELDRALFSFGKAKRKTAR